MPDLQVRHVEGRYPYKPRALRSDNIHAIARAESINMFRIRLDDTADGHEDMWLELIVEVEEQS